MRFTVVLGRDDEGYSVRCLRLPGCWSQGDTRDEALGNIRDAIREHLIASDQLRRGRSC